jgi:hypothetical protein
MGTVGKASEQAINRLQGPHSGGWGRIENQRPKIRPQHVEATCNG